MNARLGGCVLMVLADHACGVAFKVQGAVDFGGVGGNGDALFGDFVESGGPDELDLPGGVGPTANGQPVSGQWTMTATTFNGIYFVTGGANSIIDPAGFDGVEIFRAGFGADYSLAGEARVLIRDNGADKNVRFTGIGTPGEAIGGATLSQPYRLVQYDGAYRSLWVEAVPAPGAMALLIPMGLMAARRRRHCPASIPNPA